MRKTPWVLLAAISLAILPAMAQEQPAEVERPEVPDELAERIERLQDMGMDEEEALFFSILTSGDMDPAQMLMLMMMMDQGGGGGGDAMGALMFMNMLGGKKEAEQPVVLDRGETLLIIDDGVLYNVNLEKLELQGSIPYAAGGRGGEDALLPLLQLMWRGRERAEEAAIEVPPPVEVLPAPAPEPQ